MENKDIDKSSRTDSWVDKNTLIGKAARRNIIEKCRKKAIFFKRCSIFILLLIFINNIENTRNINYN